MNGGTTPGTGEGRTHDRPAAVLGGARILHTFANFKWTGPADPAIRIAGHLRRHGADVVFAQAEWTIPGAEHRMASELERARMPVIGGLQLRKHFAARSLLGDARRLAARLRGGEFDVVHAHLPSDHLLAALAKRRARRQRSPVLVRSLYDPDAPARGWRERVAFAVTDGVVAPTWACAEQVRERFGFPAERVLWLEPPIERRRSVAAGDLRARLGLSPDDVVVGITARIQPHRRFDLLWDVARLVVDREPRARFVLLGRGNEQDVRRLVQEPIARLDLGAHVRLPGYLYEPDYTLALRSLDVFLFLVPGSDGTCRAVGEALGLGLPVVATTRGMLPTLLGPDPGRGLDPCGMCCPEEASALAAALVRLAGDAEARRQLASAALLRARAADPDAAARRLLAFYAELRDRARREPR